MGVKCFRWCLNTIGLEQMVELLSRTQVTVYVCWPRTALLCARCPSIINSTSFLSQKCPGLGSDYMVIPVRTLKYLETPGSLGNESEAFCPISTPHLFTCSHHGASISNYEEKPPEHLWYQQMSACSVSVGRKSLRKPAARCEYLLCFRNHL